VAPRINKFNLKDSNIQHEWTLSSGVVKSVESFTLESLRKCIFENIKGNVLQIGSKSSVLDNHMLWRKSFATSNFIGMDIEPGENVDVVCDITDRLGNIRKKTGVVQFDFIICRHLLEHVRKPWEAAQNIVHLLKPDGYIWITVPWVQSYHGYPEDYWRMSFSAVRSLFEKIDFQLEFYTGAKEDLGYRILINGQKQYNTEDFGIEGNLFQIQIDEALDQNMFDDFPGKKIHLSRQYIPCSSVNLIGMK
jgi:SAM-dependent methyltransferase